MAFPQATGPGRASPVPAVTFSTFHAPYAGKFVGAVSRIYTPSVAFALTPGARHFLFPTQRQGL